MTQGQAGFGRVPAWGEGSARQRSDNSASHHQQRRLQHGGRPPPARHGASLRLATLGRGARAGVQRPASVTKADVGVRRAARRRRHSLLCRAGERRRSTDLRENRKGSVVPLDRDRAQRCSTSLRWSASQPCAFPALFLLGSRRPRRAYPLAEELACPQLLQQFCERFDFRNIAAVASGNALRRCATAPDHCLELAWREGLRDCHLRAVPAAGLRPRVAVESHGGCIIIWRQPRHRARAGGGESPPFLDSVRRGVRPGKPTGRWWRARATFAGHDSLRLAERFQRRSGPPRSRTRESPCQGLCRTVPLRPLLRNSRRGRRRLARLVAASSSRGLPLRKRALGAATNQHLAVALAAPLAFERFGNRNTFVLPLLRKRWCLPRPAGARLQLGFGRGFQRNSRPRHPPAARRPERCRCPRRIHGPRWVGTHREH